MRMPPSTILLVLTLLGLVSTGLTACGGKAARQRSQALLEGQSGEKWFCQIAEGQEDWDCVQSNQLAAAPAPERMPVPRVESVATDLTASPGEVLDVAEVDEVELQTDSITVLEEEVIEDEALEEEVAEDEALEDEVIDEEVSEPDIEETEVVEEEFSEPGIDQAEGVELDAVVSETDSGDLPDVDLYSLPDDTYVVQLVAMRDARTLEYLVRDRNLTNVIPARVAAGAQIFYVLLAGPYESEAAAQEFAAIPPDTLSDFNLWVRSMRSLKAAMREADELSAIGVDDQG